MTYVDEYTGDECYKYYEPPTILEILEHFKAEYDNSTTEQNS